jgi:hypothetical protein
MSSHLFFVIFDWASTLIGLGYPIWRSTKLLEAKKHDNELVQWLTFWVFVAMLTKFEEFASLLFEVRAYFIYNLFRLLFIAWMIHPKYKGALYLYFSTEPWF